jgi:hypothetical protein
MKLPDYIIIGSTRCGTTSLYNYISSHPKASLAKGKGFREIHFFDYAQNYTQGIEWYKAQFPNAVTGETSPTYLQHPLVPIRVKEYCPDTKLIALLRNPIDRAWSDYHLAVGKGWASKPFKQCISDELKWKPKNDLFWSNSFFMSDIHLLGFLERGKYAEQLEQWFDYFEREQIMVIDSQDLYANTHHTLQHVYEFLGLPNHTSNYRVWHKGNYNEMSPKMRKRLETYFKPHNDKLESLLGVKLSWM